MLIKTNSYCTEKSCAGKKIRLIEKMKVIGINPGKGKSYILFRYWRVKTRKEIEKFQVESEKVFCPKCKTVTTKRITRGYTPKDIYRRFEVSSYFARGIRLFEYNLEWVKSPSEPKMIEKNFTGVLYFLNPKVQVRNEYLTAVRKHWLPEGYVIAGKTIRELLGKESGVKFLVKEIDVKYFPVRRETYVPVDFKQENF